MSSYLRDHDLEGVADWAGDKWHAYDSGGGCVFLVRKNNRGEVGVSRSETMRGHFLAVAYDQEGEEVAALTFYPGEVSAAQIHTQAGKILRGEELPPEVEWVLR
jgi:hypothetical protein